MEKRWSVAIIGSLLVLLLVGGLFAANSPRSDYIKTRAQLVTTDLDMRLGADIVLTDKEQVVDAYLSATRQNQIKAYREANYFPPADMFYRAKKTIEKDPIFKLLKTMPKGGALHVHTSASGTAEWVVDKALTTKNTYVCWQKECCVDDKKYVQGTLTVAKQCPEQFIPITEAVKTEDFRREMIQLLTIGPEDEKVADIWDEFEKIFDRGGSFIWYRPVYEGYFRHAMTVLAEDNVQYLEYRTGMSPYTGLNDEPYTTEETFLALQRIAHEVARIYPGFKVKLIASGHRSYTQEKLRQKLDIATKLYNNLDLRDEGHPFVIGFDLVGQEDTGHKTIDYLDIWLNERLKGNNIPFYFHNGESDWFFDDNLYDTVIEPIASKRIGHGFNLFRFPTVLEQVKKKKIALEICPISNQVLRYINDLRMHPGSEYINRGVPVVLSSDDPSIFGYQGLTYDFYEAYMAWGFDLRTLKKLARNSLEYSGMDEEEKSKAIAQWEKAWYKWIHDVYNKIRK